MTGEKPHLRKFSVCAESHAHKVVAHSDNDIAILALLYGTHIAHRQAVSLAGIDETITAGVVHEKSRLL